MNACADKEVLLHGLLDGACGLIVPAAFREGDAEIEIALAG